MLQTKMKAVINEVCDSLAERDELIHAIALALLTRKNLFVLGDPGQAKSQAIDMFRSHIEGAKQFDILPFLDSKKFPKMQIPFPEDFICVKGINSLIKRTILDWIAHEYPRLWTSVYIKRLFIYRNLTVAM